MATGDKKYAAKIYGLNGSSLKMNIPNGAIRSAPEFSDRINGGMGECILDFVTPFDDFDEGVKSHMNLCWIFGFLMMIIRTEDGPTAASLKNMSPTSTER